MAKTRIDLNHRDLDKLLKEASLPLLREIAEKILAVTGTEHYEMEEWVGRTRGRYTVRTKPNFKSRAHEAKHHNLIRALGSIHG